MLRRNALSGMLHHAIDFNLSGVFPVNQQLGIHRDMADPGIISDQILELFLVTGVALPATIKIEPRWPSAVRLAGASAPRFAHQAATNRQPFGKGPRSTASTFQFRATTAPAMASTSSMVIASTTITRTPRCCCSCKSLLDLPFAFHHRCQRDMPDLMMGLRRQQSRHHDSVTGVRTSRATSVRDRATESITE